LIENYGGREEQPGEKSQLAILKKRLRRREKSKVIHRLEHQKFKYRLYLPESKTGAYKDRR